MKLSFTKMEGCGNDYLYFDCFDPALLAFFETPGRIKAVCEKLSDRHFGVGGDGVILICPSDTADGQMRMFNIDGSEGNMCGNGVRCVAKYLYDAGRSQSDCVRVETKSGIKVLEMTVENGKAVAARVDMGAPVLESSQIPTTLTGNPVINHPVTVNGQEYRLTCVSMGNPHCVSFGADPRTLDLKALGQNLEWCELFPQGVNSEFVEVLSPTSLRMRVWERGSGETLACGTGACAVVVAAVLNGYCEKNTDVSVLLSGGELVIRYTDDTVYMTGPAVTVFTGCYDWAE